MQKRIGLVWTGVNKFEGCRKRFAPKFTILLIDFEFCDNLE